MINGDNIEFITIFTGDISLQKGMNKHKKILFFHVYTQSKYRHFNFSDDVYFFEAEKKKNYSHILRIYIYNFSSCLNPNIVFGKMSSRENGYLIALQDEHMKVIPLMMRQSCAVLARSYIHYHLFQLTISTYDHFK